MNAIGIASSTNSIGNGIAEMDGDRRRHCRAADLGKARAVRTVREECKRLHGDEPCIKTHGADGRVVEVQECLDWCPVLRRSTELLVAEPRAAA